MKCYTKSIFNIENKAFLLENLHKKLKSFNGLIKRNRFNTSRKVQLQIIINKSIQFLYQLCLFRVNDCLQRPSLKIWLYEFCQEIWKFMWVFMFCRYDLSSIERKFKTHVWKLLATFVFAWYQFFYKIFYNTIKCSVVC